MCLDVIIIVRFLHNFTVVVSLVSCFFYIVTASREIEQQQLSGDGGRADYSKVPLPIMTSLNLIVFSNNNEYFLAERKFPALFRLI